MTLAGEPGHAPTAARPTTALDAERVVRAPLPTVRQALLGALARLGFHVTAEQLTALTAHRGSAMTGRFSPRHTPLTAEVALEPMGDGCQIRYHLTHPPSLLAGAPRTADPVVSQLFSEVQQALDHAIAQVDPDAAARFSPPVWSGGVTDPSVTGPVAVIRSAEDQAVDKVGAALSGTDARRSEVWRQREGLLIAAPGAVAFLEPADAQAHLAVATMVVGQRDSLPPNLMSELEHLAVRVERSLAAAATPLVRVDISEAERKVVDFLHLQVRIRSRLPVRTLQRCRDCRFEKVTNPDLTHLVQRNRRLRSLTSAFGATLSRGGISPFVLVGTLFQVKGLDPDYVCPRCQGTSADSTLVAFCPGCGELCKDAVLRLCAKCGHDYRAGLAPDDLWGDPPEVAAAAMPVGVPHLGPGGGAWCDACGAEFTALWRVVVLTGDGRLQERFVCATTPACAPASLATPVSVEAPRPLPPPTSPPWTPPTSP